MIQTANKLLAASEVGCNSPTNKWQIPFPMGVFGTLRSRSCNNPLMHRGLVKEHRKAFMPNFFAKSLWLYYQLQSCAPFEVFFYEPEEWRKMISAVDCLENFNPGKSSYGYYRTLAWLHLLPNDYNDSDFSSNRGYRDLAIPEITWHNYEKLPCWVYSNKSANESAKERNNGYPIIWD